MPETETSIPETPPTSRRNLYCAIGAALLGITILVAAGAAWAWSHPGLWRAYTDGRGIYVRDGNPDVRPVMWAPAQGLASANDASSKIADAVLSQRGTTLVFSAKAPDGDDLDLYTCRFNGATWSAPEPIIWINTNADELAPSLGAGGRAMFFCSDRKGGMGGLDLYVSWWDGQRWTQAFNLGSGVNSEFDECDPSLAPGTDTLYFASNRPASDATPEQRKSRWDSTVAKHDLGDLDIYAAEGISIPSRSNPLRDAAFRKAMITQLGGSPETEEAVLKALRWLAETQEADGHWDMEKHGGQKGQDIAGTALAALSFLGYGVQYTERSEFQETVYRAVRWLKAKAIEKDGNFTKGVNQGMYGHGMAAIALAESYAVTKDRTLREPLEKAIRIIIDSQNRETGGWRYDSKPPPTGDTSVTGWQVMALHSARKAGIDVPAETLRLADKWMARVAASKGAYGYTDARKITEAMTAEGMFVRQLLGAKRAEKRQQETAEWMTDRLPTAGKADFYYWYYACLALYQQQGPQWATWNEAIKPTLLKLQSDAGTWEDSRRKQFGKVGASAAGALCLEVYYRYMWQLDQEADPVVEANKKLGRSPIEFPQAPAELIARRVAELSSPSVDRGVRTTARGDFLYFTSDRPGGAGGMDVYRTRIIQNEFQAIESAGPLVNSPADDVSPSPACFGSLLLVASDREAPGKGLRLYTQTARELECVEEGWQASIARHWVVVAGILLGLLILVLLGCAFWPGRSAARAGVTWRLTYLGLLFVAAWLGVSLWVWAHPENWRRYTDRAGLELPAGDVSLRHVVWERPLQADTETNRRPNLLSVAGSPRGRVIVFSRQLPTEDHSDLLMMRFEAGRWSEPLPLITLNTDADETSPFLSRDGTTLLFHSNRPGGRGGQDIYASRWKDGDWTPPTGLGSAVNTPADECDPCLSPDETSLYFSSNRAAPGGRASGDYDIYRVDGFDAAQSAQAPGEPLRVEALSSHTNDRHPAFTWHGDFVYVSSDRTGSSGGMDLYRARVSDGQIGTPVNAGLRVNSAQGDLSVSPTCQGFELWMSSDRIFNNRQPLLLYSQAASEVSPYVDNKALRWMERSKWWLVALGVGLLLLIALLIWYFKWGRYGRWGALTRCMVISVLLHAMILVGLSLWMIRQEIQLGSDGPMEIAVDANALASERLAQDLRETVSEIPNTREMLYIESDAPFQELPDYEPVNAKSQTMVESDFAVDPTPVRTDVRDVRITEEFRLPRPQPVTHEKVSLRFKPTDLDLEDRPPEAKVEQEASKPVEVAIAPIKTVDRISEAAKTVRETGGKPEERGSKMAEGALPEVDGTEHVTVASARPPTRSVPQLRGPGEKLSKRIPPLTIEPGTWLGGDKGEGTGKGSGADRLDPYLGRVNKDAMARIGGGGDDTERAIARALEWFTRTQESDGRWSLEKHGGSKGHDNAATGFAMLCYMGWNIKHTEDDKHGYRPVMEKAVKWLVGRIGKDGDLTGGESNGMYDQGVASMALAEAYGLTKDPALKDPLERAIGFILRSQNKRLGGWRYKAGSNDCDTSVVGWQVMALTSARMAGIEVPEQSLQLAEAWLARVASGPQKGRYSYQENRGPTPTMTAEAMFCRQIMGTPRTDDRQAGSADYLRTSLPNPRNANYYYWYYGALALHQHQGEIWREWNAKMKEVLLESQAREGAEAGSWPDNGQWVKKRGGKVMSTAMAALSLEVYYRYLPMYSLPEPTEPEKK